MPTRGAGSVDFVVDDQDVRHGEVVQAAGTASVEGMTTTRWLILTVPASVAATEQYRSTAKLSPRSTQHVT